VFFLIFGFIVAWDTPRKSAFKEPFAKSVFLGEFMPVFGKDFVSLTGYIRSLRGGSQPILAQASDGHTYVVKFANNLQGPNLLFNESAGSELYRACGLAVPEWRPLEVSEDFLDENHDCWMQTPEGQLRPASGLCYGSRFLGGPRRAVMYWHMIANQLLTFATNILYNTILSDMETGYKVFRRQVLEGIPLRANRFDFEPEFTAKILKRHTRVFEVPISFNPRDYSEGKKIKLIDAFMAIWALIKYRFID